MTGVRSVCRMRDARWPEGAFAAEFADERHFAGALAALREQGYSKIETYTPYPVPRTEAALPEPPSLLPPVVLLAGFGGGLAGYWIQWYTNAVSYPLNIGGRPAHAAPAFFIPTFEGTILAASIAAFVGLFALLRLPQPWHPILEAEGIERASIDHFWIAIDATDGRGDAVLTRRALEELNPLRIARVPSSE
jgi:Protein of unknown function (DUF3341)